jgi:two-component system catabolic regulation response regulator CreB
MTSLRVLLIEDEPSIADNILFALRTEHFEPVWCATGTAGLAAFSQQSFGFVILDIGLPDQSGFDICREIRKASRVPVLFLSARDEELDRVLGLELGADDYVTKPFSPRELVARVRAILRRTEATPVPSAAPPPKPCSSLLTHDSSRKRVLCAGQELDLTAHEYHLLLALLAHPGRVFSRDQLMELAWEDPAAASDRTVDAHIKTLRAKLRVAAPEADPIETRRGLGYALREEVAR